MQKIRAVLLAAVLPAAALTYEALPSGALGDGATPESAQPALTVAQPDGPTGEAINCKKNFSSGAGNTFLGWCFSDDGNIMKFESPAAQEHIRNGVFVEGYAVCATGQPDAFDNGSASANFGASTYPTANSVRRNTPAFQLDMTFSQNAPEKLVIITVKIKNVTGSVKNNVRLSRFADIDMNGTASDDRWDKSVASVVASQSNMLSLTARSFEVGKLATLESFGDLLNDTGCDATTPLTVPNSGDLSARVTYNLGNIAAGATRTVIFRYSRF